MLTIHEALTRVMTAARPVETETVPLAAALDRVLATHMLVCQPHPPFDASAMDGYAVRAADTRLGTLPVSGEARAGAPLEDAFRPGTAVRIFTGAPMPSGADAVIIQENVTVCDGAIRFTAAVTPGQHVRRRGEDLETDAVALRRGDVLDAGAVAVAASQGFDRLEVYRRPTVFVLSTGDELHPPGAPLPPGGIYDSNGPMMAALAQSAGCEVMGTEHAGDDDDALDAAIARGLTADVLLTSGGVSVGDYDLVQAAFERAGIERGFWKVALKPGKPLAFGRRDGTPVIGLPGNPTSAFVTFALFVRPLLRALAGDARPYAQRVTARLATPLRRRSCDRTELRPARIIDGGVHVELARSSGSVAATVGVEAFAVFPRGETELETGAPISVLRLREPGAAEPMLDDL